MTEFKSISWRGEKISSLVLGTAQLGMDYGIANSMGRPSDNEASRLINAAWYQGIRFFDTAQAYGESEVVLGKTLRETGKQSSAMIITKLSPSLSPKSPKSIVESIDESLKKLGVKKLWGLMLHRAEWLEFWNEGLGDALEEMRKSGRFNYIGVSVYSPEEAKNALDKNGIDMIQSPCSAWDQRMIKSGMFEYAKSKNKLCFVRSIFLQGLILMTPEEVKKKLPPAFQASLKWSSFAEAKGLSIAELAAKFAKSLNLPVVVGMERAEQVEENMKIFSEKALDSKTAEELSKDLCPFLNEDLINPSKWNSIR